ncbi:hypothetical protein MPTK1_6g14900 [Marchantia polymorpha subsp. ruderalis]|uniref:Leucine-rich repeat-containing N-terminal plant-type domain-containing protein n=4 Tax=Marchantia polymorpha TaxID=3197 RepID=A0AAF6BS50_MARPO|nr:hypothetical protein MARPO_0056s0001 [Marchantia polymorpha]BBN14834.1 hypothetical protein Mp_6g14900 [Marchantia polymorpha subsp. ruderalis]|eukprot:PTQ37516.1 hypothetical protein MARPO_0056s0001 [Marchantia polymorpha]
MHLLRRSTGRASVVSSPDLPALRERFRMLVILVLCCLQLGACAVGQDDTTFGEISRIETLDETLQDPDFDARAESVGKEHGSINIDSGLPPASSVEGHMSQQQAHGGQRSQRELQQFRLEDQAVDTSLTNRHEPLHRFQEESTHSRRISRTLLQDSFGEVDALLQFKAEIENYTDNAFDGWTTGNRSTYCSWTRVICDDELHVISLNFSALEMNGTLGPSLGKLEYLEDLDLSHNFLLSELPVEWGRLQRLQTLNVHDNFLFGGVPAEYGNMSSLRVLYIGEQGELFNGFIPEELGLLFELEVLALGTRLNFDSKQENYPDRSNRMRGHIPKSIANCTKLWYMDFSDNFYLTGPIPREYGQLVNLEYLSFEQNDFTGSIPSELGNLTNIKFLHLRYNALEGEFPVELASLSELKFLNVADNFLTGSFLTVESPSWSRLEKLYISGNNFHGGFPKAVTAMTALTTFDMSSNEFTGSLPENLGQLANLQAFDFTINQLDGKLPDSLNNCTQLFMLGAAKNNLTGTLEPLRNLSLLVHLRAQYNRFTGTLEPLRNLSLLVFLFATNNRLTGTLEPLKDLSLLDTLDARNNRITGTLEPLRNLSALKSLEAWNNNLTGTLEPLRTLSLFILTATNNNLTGTLEPLRNLSELRTLYVGNNRLTGTLEPLRTLSLSGLDVANNRLTGTLEPLRAISQFRILDVANNRLTGTLEPLRNLSLLFILYASNNRLTGTLEPLRTLSLLSDVMEYLLLSHNDFRGPIPAELGKLPNLVLLLLHNNGLSEPIPTSLANLQYIQEINLSNNFLTGVIPPELGRLQFMQYLSLHSNNLTGTIPAPLANCGSLRNIRLSNNKLTGNVTQIDFLQLRSLESFSVNGNQLGGEFPVSVYNCTDLKLLDLSSNKFSGELPDNYEYSQQVLRKLRVLKLSSNKFGGRVPGWIWKLSELQVLDLSHNSFTGVWPTNLSGLEGFSRLEATPDDGEEGASISDEILPIRVEVDEDKLLEQISIEAKGSRLELEYVLETLFSIDLSYNQLSGRLPHALGELRRLTYLNLAHNNFSGEIPQVFGDLLHLQSLDLSANYLTGKIPAVLSRPSLSYLKLSYNFLEGEIPTANAFSTRYEISSFKPGNNQLCGPPLETTCATQDSNASGSSATFGAPSFELLDDVFWRAFEIGIPIGFVILIGVVIGMLRTMPCARHWLLHTQDFARHFKQGRYGVFNEPT